MNFILLAPAVFVVATLVLWGMYLAVMQLKAARDAGKIPAQAMTPAKCILMAGLFYDFLYHVVIGTLVFLDIPREWVLTSRLERYQKQGGWRGAMANYICKNLLDWADPDGCHCRH